MSPESFSDGDMRRLAERVQHEHDLRETELQGVWEHVHSMDEEVRRLRERMHELGERIVAEQLVQIYTERTEKLEERVAGLEKRFYLIAGGIVIVGAVANVLLPHLFK